MNLLVGATGFVGGHVVEYLFQQGEISKGAFRKGSHLKIMDTNGVQGTEVDLFDHHTLHEAMEGVDAVYSMASPMPGSDTDFARVNTEGLLSLLEAATEAKAKAFVHLSTLDVFGFRTRIIADSTPHAPSNEYQRSKDEGERLLGQYARRNSTPRVTVIRSAKGVGSRDESLVVPVLKMLEAGKVVLPSGGRMSFSHPRDIAQGMYRAATGQVPIGRTYMIKSFDCTPEELARGMAASVGKDSDVRKQGFLSSSQIPKYTLEQLKAALMIEGQDSWKELGYSPLFDLQKTCDEIAAWYKKSPWVTEAA